MDLRTSRGFSLLELLFVVLITMTVAAIAVPMSGNALGYFRLTGDARSISNAVAVTKMRAASDFTRARLYIDLGGRTHHMEVFAKAGTPAAVECPMGLTECWLVRGGATSLSLGVLFDFASLATPPLNSQAAPPSQASACLDNANAPITGTACVVFNSRGVPASSGVIYLRDTTAVYAIAVKATGMSQVWRSGISTAEWVKQ